MKNTKALYLIIAAVGILFASALVFGAGRRPEKQASPLFEAPEIELVDLDGNVSALSEYRGKAIMLNFWATWCPPCRYEKPFMQKIYDDYRDKGFLILAVSVRENSHTVQNYIETHGYTYPVFLDARGEAFSAYDQTGGIPQTYLIDRKGNITSFLSGARDWTDQDNRRLIEEILKNG